MTDLTTPGSAPAGELCGYRAIWHALRIKHHIHVPRREVERIMCEVNPDAAIQRRERRLSAECTLTLVQIFVGTWMVSMLTKCYKTYILFLVLLGK